MCSRVGALLACVMYEYVRHMSVGLWLFARAVMCGLCDAAGTRARGFVVAAVAPCHVWYKICNVSVRDCCAVADGWLVGLPCVECGCWEISKTPASMWQTHSRTFASGHRTAYDDECGQCVAMITLCSCESRVIRLYSLMVLIRVLLCDSLMLCFTAVIRQPMQICFVDALRYCDLLRSNRKCGVSTEKLHDHHLFSGSYGWRANGWY